jgi:hypothetical protein
LSWLLPTPEVALNLEQTANEGMRRYISMTPVEQMLPLCTPAPEWTCWVTGRVRSTICLTNLVSFLAF